MTIARNDFVPRLEAPDKTDLNWISNDYGGYNYCITINKRTGSVLPNCTGYSWGRWREILKRKAPLPTTDAENWYPSTTLRKGQTPELGAVICWRKGAAGVHYDGAGHVMIVEEILDNGVIVCSGSNYSGTYFYTRRFLPGYAWPGTGLIFQGFIYLPEDEPEPEHSEDILNYLPERGYFAPGDRNKKVEHIAEWFHKTFPLYAKEKVLGPYYGRYLKAAVAEFQRRTGLDPDGFIGPITLTEMSKYGFKP